MREVAAKTKITAKPFMKVDKHEYFMGGESKCFQGFRGSCTVVSDDIFHSERIAALYSGEI